MEIYQTNFVKNDVSFFLNIVRIVAAELVLIGHILAYNLLSKQFSPTFNGISALYFPYNVNFIEIADFGLVLFFLISGLLISNSIFSKLKKGKFSFTEYFFDRFARIYSGLIPCLFIILILDYINITFFPAHFLSVSAISGTIHSFLADFSLVNFIGSLTLLNHLPFSSLDIGFGFGTARPLWVLPIEWWLYISFGWLILQWKQIYARKWLYILVFLVFSIIPLGYLFLQNSNGLIVVVWLFGVLITAIMSSYTVLDAVPFKPVIAAVLFVFAIVMMMIYKGTVMNLPAISLIMFAFLFIIAYLKGKTFFSNTRLTKTVQFVAGYTFTLYLIQMPVILLVNVLSFPDLRILVIVSFIIANLCAIPIAYFTEMRHKVFASWLKTKFLGVAA
jgi:peptidoglycan/LPS O-acetylase OafA/YrhL